MTDRKILGVKGVTVSFDNFKVLDDLDFSMNYGEVRFLIGPNGAGKTTLLDIITRKTTPSGGKVIFDGSIDVTRWQEHALTPDEGRRGGRSREREGPLHIFGLADLLGQAGLGTRVVVSRPAPVGTVLRVQVGRGRE